MSERKEKAAEYRRQAEFCLEMAGSFSLRSHRERMIEMAREWLALAQLEETKGD